MSTASDAERARLLTVAERLRRSSRRSIPIDEQVAAWRLCGRMAKLSDADLDGLERFVRLADHPELEGIKDLLADRWVEIQFFGAGLSFEALHAKLDAKANKLMDEFIGVLELAAFAGRQLS